MSQLDRPTAPMTRLQQESERIGSVRTTSRGSGGGFGAGGMLVFILPLFGLAVAILLFGGRRGSTGGTPPVPPAGAFLEVHGLAGALDGENGAQIEISLVPLHADARRQVYDREKLRKRYDLGPGEPWRLVVSYIGDSERPDADEPKLDLSQISISDASGAVMTRFPDSTTRSADLRDPLVALLSQSSNLLGPGDEVQLIVWGTRLGDGARASGLIRAGTGQAEMALFATSDSDTEVALADADLMQERELSLRFQFAETAAQSSDR